MTKKDPIIIYNFYVKHISMCIFTEMQRQIILVLLQLQFQSDISESLSTTNQLIMCNELQITGVGTQQILHICTPLASIFPLLLISILQVTIWAYILQEHLSDNTANPLESSSMQYPY